MGNFKYKVEEIYKELEKYLNDESKKGWRCVGAIDNRSSTLVILEKTIEENSVWSQAMNEISSTQWQNLASVFKWIENGRKSESTLLINETFLCMLAAVKYDVDNFMKIPDFIRESNVCVKYCLQANSDVKEIINESKLSKIEKYKRYLGL